MNKVEVQLVAMIYLSTFCFVVIVFFRVSNQIRNPPTIDWSWWAKWEHTVFDMLCISFHFRRKTHIDFSLVRQVMVILTLSIMIIFAVVFRTKKPDKRKRRLQRKLDPLEKTYWKCQKIFLLPINHWETKTEHLVQSENVVLWRLISILRQIIGSSRLGSLQSSRRNRTNEFCHPCISRMKYSIRDEFRRLTWKQKMSSQFSRCWCYTFIIQSTIIRLYLSWTIKLLIRKTPSSMLTLSLIALNREV